VWEELTAFKREHGATVFFNTHYMDEADNYADRIAIIDRGKMVGEGTPEELKRSIGGEVIKLTVVGEAAPQAVVDRLRGMDLVTDLVVAGAELSLVVKDASMALPVVIEAMRERDVAVRRVTMEAPTLDDVFLKYAGTRLEEGGRSVDTRQTRRMIKVG
jgi:ABC-2 type transport system ATP-binding protein